MELILTKNGSFKLYAEPVQIDSIIFEQGTGSDSNVRVLDTSHFPVFEAWESQAWDYSHNGHAHHVLPRWRGFFEVEGMQAGDKITIVYHLIEKPVSAPAANQPRSRPRRAGNETVRQRAA